jgi:spore germination protein GerM
VKRRLVAGGLLAVAAFSVVLITSQRRRSLEGIGSARLIPLAADLEGTRGVYLYFGASGADSLVAEYRDVVVKDRPADQVRAIYRELLAGPTTKLEPLFPEGTELLNTYWTERGTLYLDWNRALVQGFRGGSGRERMLLASIARTAKENLPDVGRVAILVEGEPIESIGGHFDTRLPLDVRDWR